MQHILIIGAGAAGLMAGRILSSQGHRITFLEARDRIGGRIHTQQEGTFTQPAELGAEFVHGNLPVTIGLLKEAGIAYPEAAGDLWHFRKGRFHQDDQFTEHWELLMKKMDELETDCSIRDFLDREFAGAEYDELRASVLRFTAGFDAADPSDASALSLRDEWQHEEDALYRVAGGYGRLMRFLEAECLANQSVFRLSAVISDISWSDDKVAAVTSDGKRYEADRAIVTVPAAVLKEDVIRFDPELPRHLQAFGDIGAGHAIRLVLQFREAFWTAAGAAKLDKLHMLLSDQEFPTWWTQYPAASATLTGWIGGPAAREMSGTDQGVLLQKALESLSRIFGLPVSSLEALLEDHAMTDWTAEPFTRCCYAYDKVETAAARALLRTPVKGRLYFAGEALYTGQAKGTVEAALCSGQETASALLRDIRPEE